jgi:hypothetical protein
MGEVNRKFKDFSKVLQWCILYNGGKASSETAILQSADTNDHGLIIGINGGWGEGKTTFLNHFYHILERQSFKIKNYRFVDCSPMENSSGLKKSIEEEGNTPCIVIKYNAWSQDYIEEPFISLIGQMYSQVKDKLFADWKSAVQGVFKFLLNTSKMINVNGVSADISQIGSVAQDAFSSSIDKFLEDQERFDDVIKKFKISIEKIGDKDTLKVIFIDELDRCMPTFAVKLLERLKHFFNIKNVVIVIACDRTNLTETIKKVYGNIDADHYLSRFFNLELQLPELPSEILIKEHFATNTTQAIILSEFFAMYNVRAREMIKTLNFLEMVKNAVGWGRFETIILIALKLSRPREFEALVRHKFSFIPANREFFYTLLSDYEKLINYHGRPSFKPNPKLNNPKRPINNIICDYGNKSPTMQIFYEYLYRLFLWFLIRDNGYESAKKFLNDHVLAELENGDLLKKATSAVFAEFEQKYSPEMLTMMINNLRFLM